VSAVPKPSESNDSFIVYEDIPYAETRLRDEPKALHCSIYLPRNSTVPPPVLIWFHGGAFKFGSHNQRICQRVGRYLAPHGIAVISGGYRLHATFDDLSPTVQPQVADHLAGRQRLIRPGLSQERSLAATEDGVALLAWAAQQSSVFGWSDKRIVAGVSAGGILALNLLFTAPALGLARNPLHGAFVVSGGYDFPHLVQPDLACPIMALHNPDDKRVSIRGVEMLQEKLGPRMRLLTSQSMMHGKLELTADEPSRAALRRLLRFVQGGVDGNEAQ